MNFNFDLVVTSFPLLLLGAGVTIKITAMSVALGVLIGLFVGIARISRIKILRVLAAIYVDFFRGTPLLVQIFLFYFAVPVITGQRIDPYVAAVGSCGINSGAYVAEIVRAGIQSIDEGQMEAGRSLGMSRLQTTVHVILPQAMKNILPAIGNEMIALLKETAVAGYVAVQDLTRAGNLIRNNTFDAFNPLMVVALTYLAIVVALTRLLAVLEKRLHKGDRH